MKKFVTDEYPKSINDIIEDLKLVDRAYLNDKVILYLAGEKRDGNFNLYVVKLDFISKDADIPESIDYDYGDSFLMRKSIAFEECLNILQSVMDNGKLGIPRMENYSIKTTGYRKYYLSSNTTKNFIEAKFPTLCYEARLEQSTSQIPHYLMIGNGNPPYVGATKAFVHLFNMPDTKWGYNEPYFIIAIPDLRARIKTIKIRNEKILIEIESKHISENELGIQYFVSGNGLIVSEPFTKIKKGKVNISFKNEPEEILVILSTKEGEVLDKKEINTSYTKPDTSIVIETPSYSLKEIIAGGENKHVEFKSQLGQPERLIRSVVAFANTKGGRIFLGVSEENGKIVSVKNPSDTKNTIITWIGSYCDPKIDVSIQYSKELKILIIEVPEGDHKPYFLVDEGVFVRVGGTNRHASKAEWQQMLPLTRDVGSFSGMNYR